MPEVPWSILHRWYLSGTPKGSGQGDCRSVDSNNGKGEDNLEYIIPETNSVL